MGKRGPAPQPTALKLLRGNPGCRPVNDREPQPRAVRPKCPAWLDIEAKSIWRWLVPRLEAMGVLTEIDRQALTRYCQVWSQWRAAVEFIQKHGSSYPIKDDKGQLRYIQQFPQVSIAAKLGTQLTRLEQEFGLTPASRTKIRVEASSDAEKQFEAFLQAGPA